MRTVSFSDSNVRALLAKEFVSTYTNTQGNPSAGGSFAHSPYEQPGFVQRGIGKQNVQVIFMTPAGNIFHVATGFLPPEELYREIKFALTAYMRLEDAQRQSPDSALAKQQLVNIQVNRLRDKGYSEREVALNNTGQRSMGFGPSSFQQLVGQMDIAGGDDRLCLLRDTRYVLHNPLIHYTQFEQNPGDLVGHGQSFFGSRSGGRINNPFGR